MLDIKSCYKLIEKNNIKYYRIVKDSKNRLWVIDLLDLDGTGYDLETVQANYI